MAEETVVLIKGVCDAIKEYGLATVLIGLFSYLGFRFGPKFISAHIKWLEAQVDATKNNSETIQVVASSSKAMVETQTKILDTQKQLSVNIGFLTKLFIAMHGNSKSAHRALSRAAAAGIDITEGKYNAAHEDLKEAKGILDRRLDQDEELITKIPPME